MKFCKIKIIAFAVMYYLIPIYGYCEDFKIVINPLIDYNQQLKELTRDCQQAQMPDECKIKIKDLSGEIEKLRRHCYKNPKDYRCDGLARKGNDRVDPMEELCLRDPYATKCVRHRSNLRMNALRTVKYCKERPDSSRCKPPSRPKKKEPFIVSFCKMNPTKKMCVKHLEEERARKDPYYNEDRANLF